MEIQPESQQSIINTPHVDTTPETAITATDTIDTDEGTPIVMRVKKRDGTLEPVNVNKIVNVNIACSTGLGHVDPMRVATKVISGLYDGASTKELDQLCIQTASLLIGEEPEYSKLAARLLARYIDEEVANEHVMNFYQSVTHGYKAGLISKEKYEFVKEHKEALNIIIDDTRTRKFEYFGLRTLYDRYLLKDPQSRNVIESPQYFFLRVACGLANTFEEAKEFYELISSLDYLASSPTLFNSATLRPQLSSCYLLDSPLDDLTSIYQKYMDVAKLSKYAGGIGLSFTRVRSRGSLIKGTNGHSNGLVPWLKTLDSSVAAVNQGGRRKGAACVYLETWHADIEEFLQLRDNTGDEAQRTHNLNLANWVPDLFMRRVEGDDMWSLFDPKELPELTDLYGDDFERAYMQAEKDGRFKKQVKARDLYSRMMKTLAQTGNGWMTFKDHSNRKSNQTKDPGNVIHLSNLCTEILEITNDRETAVCNLGSVNLSNHFVGGAFDFDKLARTVRTAVKYLDRVVDINFYPIDSAGYSNNKWRPVGLGLMGLQDVFFKMGIPFDSPEAKRLSAKISEEIYYTALKTSCELAEKFGPHETFAQTRAAEGELQFDSWGVVPEDMERWEKLRRKIKKIGLRNSLMIAIAPTATIASISGVYEAIEPQVSNLFKRETLSGEFIQINKYLVAELKKRNLWTEEIRNKVKAAEGSIQDVAEIPADVKNVFRTVWEIPQKELINMAADRGAFVDQSQSLNLFMETPTIGKLSSMYMYAWKKGVKTTYYLRSRPATRISKVTTKAESPEKKQYTDEEALACSLENPEICEACQ
ncbi:MAG: ribonucleoside-diphosphate reductase subunit alpha [Pseudobdellovibrionaceae bacterium]|nr:ribonucleoside-diphosphate reductase subunit alpha [Bdellovibrionales bacterium]USN48002.1 MAG: ribonucleoside-diphosphate reductase subunit alpha [Pseudobdellovibrionaceae bacterium]